MLGGKNSRKPWDSTDIVLALAYQVLEAERCPQCGMYVWMCHSEDTDMQIEVVEDVCEALKAVDRKQKTMGDNSPSWKKLLPQPVMADPERDFIELRRPYYEEERKKTASVTEG